MSTPGKQMCLALETAVGSGSVALLRDALVVAESDRSDMRASRAEELLGVVGEVLSRAGVSLSEVTLLAVSTGPGSYSGIRIGVSTAIGLKNALGVECRGVSLLEALAALEAGDTEREIIAAVPVGKNDIAWQRFDSSGDVPRELTKPALLSLTEFKAAIRNMKLSAIRAPRDVLERIGYADLDGSRAVDDATTLAALVGRVAIEQPASADLRPIYLRSGTGF